MLQAEVATTQEARQIIGINQNGINVLISQPFPRK
jgi:hypothetical protein